MIMELRKYKIGSTVILDFFGTIFLCVIISLFSKVPLVIITIVTLFMGEVFHYAFNIPSNTMKYLKLTR